MAGDELTITGKPSRGARQQHHEYRDSRLGGFVGLALGNSFEALLGLEREWRDRRIAGTASAAPLNETYRFDYGRDWVTLDASS